MNDAAPGYICRWFLSRGNATTAFEEERRAVETGYRMPNILVGNSEMPPGTGIVTLREFTVMMGVRTGRLSDGGSDAEKREIEEFGRRTELMVTTLESVELPYCLTHQQMRQYYKSALDDRIEQLVLAHARDAALLPEEAPSQVGSEYSMGTRGSSAGR